MRRIFAPLLLLAALFCAGCGAAETTISPAALQGEWELTHPSPEGSFRQTMTFRDDGSFRLSQEWYGNYGLPRDELSGYSRSEGTYTVEGNRLKIRIFRGEGWHKYAAGPNPSIFQNPDPEWMQWGTVRVEPMRLVHTTVSAPADKDETFVEVYRRKR